ncbi:uncharacterized protein LOC113790273 isoform X2 [Dermatophagoides pteronyssinus]|uniref:uncharacterized protein LOC113790273 isoform X2 n=1 Tax=Dermatophagoides pteronyssinus TaxID=6956 RepID=UPI003F675AE3
MIDQSIKGDEQQQQQQQSNDQQQQQQQIIRSNNQYQQCLISKDFSPTTTTMKMSPSTNFSRILSSLLNGHSKRILSFQNDFIMKSFSNHNSLNYPHHHHQAKHPNYHQNHQFQSLHHSHSHHHHYCHNSSSSKKLSKILMAIIMTIIYDLYFISSLSSTTSTSSLSLSFASSASIFGGVHATPIFSNDPSTLSSSSLSSSTLQSKMIVNNNNNNDNNPNQLMNWIRFLNYRLPIILKTSFSNNNIDNNVVVDDDSGNNNDDDLDVDFDGLNNYKEKPINILSTTTIKKLPLSTEVVEKNEKFIHKMINNEEKSNWQKKIDENVNDDINDNNINERKKRSGIADQRLAELLELARMDMIRKLVRDNNQIKHHSSMIDDDDIAYGLIDPHIM